MELKQATAGTMESGDIMIQIAPTDHEGLEIQLQSSVAYQFGDQIRHVIEETLHQAWHHTRRSSRHRQRCARLHHPRPHYSSCCQGYRQGRVERLMATQ